MKKIILFALLLHTALAARALEAGVSYCVFKSETGAYVELYLYVDGASVEFAVGPDSSLQAGIEVVLYFKQQDQIVRYDKFALHSPRMRQPEHFMDIKRYALPDGDYELTTELRDLNRPDNEKRYQSPLSVRMAGNDLLQSGIQLLAAARPDTSDNSFCKNGVYMEPLARHTYGRAASELIFYHEIYHSDLALADDFLVTYRVETAETETPRTVLIAHKRRSPAPVVPLLLPIDISSLSWWKSETAPRNSKAVVKWPSAAKILTCAVPPYTPTAFGWRRNLLARSVRMSCASAFAPSRLIWPAKNRKRCTNSLKATALRLSKSIYSDIGFKKMPTRRKRPIGNI